MTTADTEDVPQPHDPDRVLRPADVWVPNAGAVSGEVPARHEVPGRSLSEVHDRRYRDACARGWPGWGGPERTRDGDDDFVDRMLLNGPAPTQGTALELGCEAGHIGWCLVTRGATV